VLYGESEAYSPLSFTLNGKFYETWFEQDLFETRYFGITVCPQSRIFAPRRK